MQNKKGIPETSVFIKPEALVDFRKRTEASNDALKMIIYSFLSISFFLSIFLIASYYIYFGSFGLNQYLQKQYNLAQAISDLTKGAESNKLLGKIDTLTADYSEQFKKAQKWYVQSSTNLELPRTFLTSLGNLIETLESSTINEYEFSKDKDGKIQKEHTCKLDDELSDKAADFIKTKIKPDSEKRSYMNLANEFTGKPINSADIITFVVENSVREMKRCECGFKRTNCGFFHPMRLAVLNTLMSRLSSTEKVKSVRDFRIQLSKQLDLDTLKSGISVKRIFLMDVDTARGSENSNNIVRFVYPGRVKGNIDQYDPTNRPWYVEPDKVKDMLQNSTSTSHWNANGPLCIVSKTYKDVSNHEATLVRSLSCPFSKTIPKAESAANKEESATFLLVIDLFIDMHSFTNFEQNELKTFTSSFIEPLKMESPIKTVAGDPVFPWEYSITLSFFMALLMYRIIFIGKSNQNIQTIKTELIAGDHVSRELTETNTQTQETKSGFDLRVNALLVLLLSRLQTNTRASNEQSRIRLKEYMTKNSLSHIWKLWVCSYQKMTIFGFTIFVPISEEVRGYFGEKAVLGKRHRITCKQIPQLSDGCHCSAELQQAAASLIETESIGESIFNPSNHLPISNFLHGALNYVPNAKWALTNISDISHGRFHFTDGAKITSDIVDSHIVSSIRTVLSFELVNQYIVWSKDNNPVLDLLDRPKTHTLVHASESEQKTLHELHDKILKDAFPPTENECEFNIVSEITDNPLFTNFSLVDFRLGGVDQTLVLFYTKTRELQDHNLAAHGKVKKPKNEFRLHGFTSSFTADFQNGEEIFNKILSTIK